MLTRAQQGQGRTEPEGGVDDGHNTCTQKGGRTHTPRRGSTRGEEEGHEDEARGGRAKERMAVEAQRGSGNEEPEKRADGAQRTCTQREGSAQTPQEGSKRGEEEEHDEATGSGRVKRKLAVRAERGEEEREEREGGAGEVQRPCPKRERRAQDPKKGSKTGIEGEKTTTRRVSRKGGPLGPRGDG